MTSETPETPAKLDNLVIEGRLNAPAWNGDLPDDPAGLLMKSRRPLSVTERQDRLIADALRYDQEGSYGLPSELYMSTIARLAKRVKALEDGLEDALEEARRGN